jgi:hypothetical protein
MNVEYLEKEQNLINDYIARFMIKLQNRRNRFMTELLILKNI